METLIAAAQEKFGEVRGVRKDRGHYVLLILRSEPALEDVPFMTIRASVQDGNAAFYFGHYDLTGPQATHDFATR